MILLVDDVKEGTWADIVARNFQAGCMVLNSMKIAINELHIDFDLGDKSGLFNGLDVLKYAKTYNLLPNIIWIVSLNPPGREAIEKFLLNMGYKQTGGKFTKGE